MSVMDQSELLLSEGERASALDAWREAAELVSTRWAAFVEAAPNERSRTFALYVAALNAEEAAAAEIAALAQQRAE
jgi:hypothetical protein